MTSSAAPANRPALMLPGLEPGFAPKRTGPLIGIDLGTTNSCVAIVERGKPVVLKSRDGYQTIPSVISFTANKLLIGHAAKRQLVPSPETTIHGAKRLVGRPFESSVVEEVRLRSFYTIVPGPDGQAAVSLGGEVYTLEELSALILLDMRMTAEQHLGQPVSRAVITCPAFYSEQQRAAVREAGRLAGLHVERVLNEPTAAALAYGYGKDLKKRIAVFDLGGGTFDATVLSVDGENFEVKATGGDTFLGGIDFDHAVVGHFLTAFEDQHGRPFEGDRVAMQRLVQEAEKAKCALHEQASVGVHIPQATNIDGQTYDLSAQLAREEMNALVKPLVDRAMTVLAQVMADAGMKPSDVDDVILVGGATRMLCVRDRLQEYFGKAPHKGVHPDEAVAVGAALLARAVETREGVRLIDVNPMTLGVALPAGRFKKVIERNTALPASKSYVIATTKNKQPSLELEVYQGEADLVAQNERLATLGFTDLPKKDKGEVRVQVNFHLSEECILTLTAVELTTGREVTTSIATKGTPSVVLRKMHTRAGAQGAAVASVGGGGFLGWLKGLFGR